MRHVVVAFSVILLLSAACNDSPTVSTGAGDPLPSTLPSSAVEIIADWGATDDGELPLALSTTDNDVISQFLSDTSKDVYVVTAIWGSLSAATTPIPPYISMDWSGKMDITGCGAVGVLSTISFEPGEDWLEPVPALFTYIAWHSITTKDIDGMVFYVVVEHDCPLDVVPQLVLETVPITLTYPIEKLAHLSEFHPVSNTAGIFVHSRKLICHPCKRGVIAGDWVRGDASYSFGTFEGVWSLVNATATDPSLSGTLKGEFWTGDTRNFMEGDWFTSDGTPAGKLKGEWMYTDPSACVLCGSQVGVFRGEIFALNGDPIGVYEGEFGHMEIPSPAKLAFKGTFGLNCERRPWHFPKEYELPTGSRYAGDPQM